MEEAGVRVSHHAYKTTAEGHDSHAPGNSLYQDVLNRREGKAQTTRKGLEDTKSHQASWHGHGADPTGLETKVHIGEAYDKADEKADSNSTDGEATAGHIWSVQSGRHAPVVFSGVEIILIGR